MEKSAAKRSDAAVAAFLFLMVFAVYASTAVSTILFEDTGEFAVGSIVLGVSHPPGYPLYTILGKLFSSIPADERAFGVVLFSSWSGAVGCCLVFFVCRLIGFTTVSSFVAGAVLGLSRTFWSQCAIPEVYAQQVLYSTAGLLASLAIIKRGVDSARVLQMLAILVSMMFLTHYISFAAFFPVAIVCWLIVWRANGRGWGLLASCVFLFCVISSLVLIMPLRSALDPAINWGGDALKFSGLVEHLKRTKFVFWENQLAFHLPTKLNYFGHFIKSLPVEFTPLFVFAGLLGLFLMLVDKRKEFVLLMFLFAVQSVGVILFVNFHYSPDLISVFRVFYFGAYVSLAVFIAAGIDGLREKAKESGAGFAKAAIPVAAVVALVFPLAVNLQYNRWMEEVRPLRFGRDIFRAMNRDGIFFLQGAIHMPPVSYMHIADGVRQDVSVIDGHGTMLLRNVSKFGFEYDFMNMPAVEDTIAEREIFALPIYYAFERKLQTTDYKMINYGPVFKVDVSMSGCDFTMWDGKAGDYISSAKTSNYETDMLGALVMSRRAQCDFELGQNLDAMATLKKIADRFPGSPYVDVSIAGMYLKYGFRARAVEMYKKAIADCPTYTEAYSKLADIYIQRGEVAMAREMYKKALELTPNLFTTMMNLANLHQSRGEYEEAIRLYKRVIEIRPEAAMAYNNLGNTYANMKKWNDALKCYRKAIEISPMLGVSYNDLGAFYITRGDYEKAIKTIHKYISIEPESAIGHFNLAVAYERSGDYNTALAHYVKAAELEPEFGSAWQKIVAILLDQDREDEARAEIKRMVAVAPRLGQLASRMTRMIDGPQR